MRARCPNCGRGFNCDGDNDCWCLRVERRFDYEEMILRTGATGCACPVCVTGRTDLARVDPEAPASNAGPPKPVRRGGRKRSRGNPDNGNTQE